MYFGRAYEFNLNFGQYVELLMKWLILNLISEIRPPEMKPSPTRWKFMVRKDTQSSMNISA